MCIFFCYLNHYLLSYHSLVLVKPRKTRPYLSERLLMGREESNQTYKQTISSQNTTGFSDQVNTMQKMKNQH